MSVDDTLAHYLGVSETYCIFDCPTKIIVIMMTATPMHIIWGTTKKSAKMKKPNVSGTKTHWRIAARIDVIRIYLLIKPASLRDVTTSSRVQFRLTMSVAALMPSLPSAIASDTSTYVVHFKSLTPSHTYNIFPSFLLIYSSNFGFSSNPRSGYTQLSGISTSAAVS